MKLLKYAALFGVVFSTLVTGTAFEASAKPRAQMVDVKKHSIIEVKKVAAKRPQAATQMPQGKQAIIKAARTEKKRLAAISAHKKVLANQEANRRILDNVTQSSAPLAYQIYCLKNPSECKGAGRAKVADTKRNNTVIASVNSRVNRSMRAVRDRGDVWSSGGKSGDCEDFALTKREALIKAGLPASALRMAVVRTQSGEGHAVLVVKTTSGDLVLDNLRQKIIDRRKTGYRWLSMASANPTRWSAL